VFIARLLAALSATALMLALAEAFGAHIAYTANLVWMVPLVAIAVLTGVSFGFAIAGATGSPEAANQLNIGLFTPVFMLAGIMYPLAGLPDAVRDAVIYAIPFAAPIEAIRGVVDGLPITEFLRQSAIAVAWLAGAFSLAASRYRFVERAG
jgi:ABC-type polysaccharide/polyol phosphate export permease